MNQRPPLLDLNIAVKQRGQSLNQTLKANSLRKNLIP